MEARHRFGKNVHVLDHPVLLSLLARLGNPKTGHPELPGLLRATYRILAAEAIAGEFPTEKAAVPTRMRALTPEGVYRGPVLKRDTKAVVAGIARAGLIPAEVCFDLLNTVLDPRGVRLDYVTMARTTDERGRVTGSHLGASKIGGPLAGRILLVPDPMGATGSTLVQLLRHYREHHGEPRKTIALPMMATPEFLRRVLGAFPRTIVYTARLDRGLTAKGYIVPGAGGIGEVLTNSWV